MKMRGTFAAATNKPWWKSITIWGSVCLFIASGLTGLGIESWMPIAKIFFTISALLIPTGIRKALR